MKAFPYNNNVDVSFGMDLRDYFAASFVTGWVSDPSMRGDDESLKLIAELSYKMADAMMEARK